MFSVRSVAGRCGNARVVYVASSLLRLRRSLAAGAGWGRHTYKCQVQAGDAVAASRRQNISAPPPPPVKLF